MLRKFLCLAGMIFLMCISLSAEETPETEEEEIPLTEISVEEPGGDEEDEEKDVPIDPSLYYIIAHVMDDDVFFAIDPEAGAAVGDLYTLVRDGEEIGLLLVNEAQEKFVAARVISFATQPRLGDEAREAARAGIEAAFYGGSFLKHTYSQSYLPMGGLRLVWSRGFFYTRPVLEIESLAARAHPDLVLSDVIPLNILAGAEITNLYFGRFQIAPVMLLGMSWVYMSGEAQDLFGSGSAFHKAHISGKAFLSLSFLVSRHVKIMAAGGILALVDVWQDLSEVEAGGYFGRNVAPFVTFGLALR